MKSFVFFVVFALGLFLQSYSIAYAERKIWISHNFSAAPNVNFGPGVLPYSPKLVNLDELDWSYETFSNYRLCFNNNPLVKVNIRDKISSIENNLKYSNKYCKNPDSVNSYKFQNDISTGLVVQNNSSGEGVTCFARFPVKSFLMSLEHFRNSEVSQKSIDELSSQLISSDISSAVPIHSFLAKEDVVELEWSTSGRQSFAYVSMTNAWRCLSPSFKYYWSKILDYCLEEMNSSELKKEEYYKQYPVLLENVEEILNQSAQCIQN